MAEQKIEEEKKEQLVAADDPVPYFRIGGQTFHSGTGSYPPDTVIPWEVPHEWDEKRWGPHYASRPPSITWTALNKAAKVLLDKQIEEVKRLTTPPPPPKDEKFEKLFEQNAQFIAILAKLVPDEDKKKK